MYTVVVRATDDSTKDPGVLSADATVTIRLGDANEAPMIESNSFVIAESLAVGSEVGNMISKDIDAGDVVTYRITSGNNDRAFNILFKQGTLKVTEDLDFESVKKYTLGVQVTDTGGNKASATATIRITDVNEAPFFPGAQDGSVDYTRNIDEVDFDGYDSNGPITSHPTGGRVVLGGGVLAKDPRCR